MYNQTAGFLLLIIIFESIYSYLGCGGEVCRLWGATRARRHHRRQAGHTAANEPQIVCLDSGRGRTGALLYLSTVEGTGQCNR